MKYFWKVLVPNSSYEEFSKIETDSEESFKEALERVSKDVGFDTRSNLRLNNKAVLAVGYICEQPNATNLKPYVSIGSKVHKNQPVEILEYRYPVSWNKLKKKKI